MRKLKLLFACLLMAVLGIGQLWADEMTLDYSALGYTTTTDLNGVALPGTGDVTITLAKGSGSTAPSYYTTGTGARTYASNTITVDAGSGTITQIDFDFTQNNKDYSVSSGTYSKTNKQWTGSASSVVFTTATGSGHNRIKSIKVTYTTSGGGDVTVKTLKSIEVSGQTVEFDQNAAFSFDGVCTATYSVTKNDVPQADEQKTVTPTSVSSPDMSTIGVKTIIVSYTEDDVTKNTTYDINVVAAATEVNRVEDIIDGCTYYIKGVRSAGIEYLTFTDATGSSVSGTGDAVKANAVAITFTKVGDGEYQLTTPNGYYLTPAASNGKLVLASEVSSCNVTNQTKSATDYIRISKTINDTEWSIQKNTNGTNFGAYKNTQNDITLVQVGACVAKELVSIAVKTNPTKTSYIINDAFDATGLVITATYDDTSTEDIAYVGNEEKFSFAGFNSASAAAVQTITVTYGGETTTFNVEILDITLQSVTVSGTPTTTSYTAGDIFDPEGLTVTGHYSDNSDVVITTGITWSYPDNDSELSFEQTSIRVVATVEEIASSPYTVSGLTVAAAPLVADWVASEHYSATTDMTEETVAFGPNSNFSILFETNSASTAPTYYTSGSAVRAYAKNTITLSSTNYNFTQIVITFGQSDGNNAITTNVGTYDAGTWTGNSKEVTFTIGGTSGNRRISAITVNYVEGQPSVATPTFSVEAGTYFETQNVAITTETADATIYYTTDGSTPTTASSVYSTPIAVSTDMTIKAIAVKTGMDNSAVASATYAMGPIFTSLEDLAAADLAHNTMVKVSFSNVAIKTIDASKKFVTFDIQKDGKDIEIYYSTTTLPTSWAVGGTLSGTILAPWKRYPATGTLNCWELAPEAGWAWTNLTYNSPIIKTIDHVTVSGTATKTAYVDGEVFDPAGLVVTLYYTDETNEVVTEGILWAPTTALTVGLTSVDVTATVENTTSAAYPVSITVSEIPTKTIAEFIADGGGRCYLIGVVSNIANSNKNCTLTDNSGSIMLYRIYENGEETDYATLDVEEGDRIKVIASVYQLYNTKDEVVGPEFVEELAPEVVAVTGVTVDPTTAIVKVGKTVALTATVLPALATNKTVSWESDAPEVATVENGVVTGVADGTAHITVTTEDGSYTATATITVEAAASYTSGEWVLVTDVAQLSLEDKIIIASTAYQKAMNTQNPNNRAQADVTITGDILTYESAPVIFTLKEGNAEGMFAFYDEDKEGYLYTASSSNNYLRTQATVDNNASWAITITEGVTSVVATASSNRNVMRYNTSGMFSCYASASQQPVALYKYYSTPLPRYTVTFTANGGTGDAPVVADQLEGAKFNLPSNTYTYAGHQFTGWNDGTDTYAVGAEYTMPAANVTFTAQWETVCSWATIYTSNVVFTGSGSYETNSYVKIGGVDYDAQKVGASDKDGSVVVTVPAGAHTLHFHATAWNGITMTITASGVTNMSQSSFVITGDPGVKASGTYTLESDPIDQHFHFTFDAVAEATEITFSKTDGGDHRFVMYGINQEGGPELQSITIGGAATKTEYMVGQSFDVTGLTVTATYVLNNVVQDPVDVTDKVMWTIDPSTFGATSQTSVNVTAMLEGKTDNIDVPVTVTVASLPEGVRDVVIVVKQGDNYYAMGQTMTSGTLNSVVLEGVINGKMINVPIETRPGITWRMTETINGVTFQAQDGNYLSGAGSTNLAYSEEPVYWEMNDTYGCYTIVGKNDNRSFFMLTSSGFKYYALSNYNTNPTGCSTPGEFLDEYVDMDLTGKEFIVIREGLSNGKIGTICWGADIYEVEGAVFYDPEVKMEDGISFVESEKVNGVFPKGTPYVFQAEGEVIRALVSTTNTTDVAGTNNGLHGTFTDITVNDPDIMIINKNKVRPSAGNLVSANRAYIRKSELPTVSNAAPGRRRLIIGREEGPTGIDNITMDAENVQKVLIDGQLYIVRDGKWYDMTGQQVR